ncbi:MAG: glycosyltransferase family 4 protein [Pyrinomonadaceae bacterium]
MPFIRGGAESHAEGLRDALLDAGHEAEIVAVPFKWYPPEKILDHMLACRLLDLTEVAGTPVDLLIGLKFPAYLIPHPNKVLWILHQHRSAYELWDHPRYRDIIDWPQGLEIRDAIRQADRRLIPEARAIYANSQNVARRLAQFCDVRAEPLYHPPPRAGEFYCAEAEDYLFFPSRLCLPKRQSLVLEALSHTKRPVRVLFAGAADHASITEELNTLAEKLRLKRRVEWLGHICDEEKRRLYANSLAVIYPPFDEDFGYVTLEAMLASKAVLTCRDSGGPLEFVADGETGLVADPTPESLAAALDQLWLKRNETARMGVAGRALYDRMEITWPRVVEKLLS